MNDGFAVRNSFPAEQIELVERLTSYTMVAGATTMTQITEQLLNQALQLSQDEREELADQLYLSLHVGDGTALAWSDEVSRRLEEVDSEQMKLYSAEEVHDDVRKLLSGE
jgi:putative addiction module component (TIGR02574 family)